MSDGAPAKPTPNERGLEGFMRRLPVWQRVGIYAAIFVLGWGILIGIGATAPEPEEDEAAETTTTTEEETTTTSEATTTTELETTTTTEAPTTTTEAAAEDRMLSFDERTTGDPQAANGYEICKQFIADRLTSPSSAEYPNYFEDDGEVVVWVLANGDYRYTSQVDSENAFGASLRSFFECTVDYRGDDQWMLVDLVLI